jgi:hypothetical protein
MISRQAACISCFLLYLIPWLFLPAQENRLLRVEMEARANAYPYELIPMGKEGLLIVFPVKTAEGESGIRLQHYTSSLQAGWSHERAFPGNPVLEDWQYAEGKAHLLFSGLQSEKAENTLLIIADPSSASLIEYAYTLPAAERIYHFDLLGPRFMIAAANRKYETKLYLLGESGQPVQIRTEMDGEQWLDDALWDGERKVLYLLLKHRASRKNQGMILMQANLQGEVLSSEGFYDERSLWPSGAKMQILGPGKILLLGTYSQDERKASFQQQSPGFERASGFFSFIWENGRPDSIHYYPFHLFTDYFKHLTASEISRMRSDRSTESPAAIDFRVFLHPIRQTDQDHWLLAAEVHYEKYQYVTRMSYDFYGRPVPTTYSIFEGYQYTNTFLAAFDPGGLKQWDHNVPFRDFRQMERRKQMELLPDPPDWIPAYLDMGRIASQVIRQNETIGGFDLSPLELNAPLDRVESSEYESIVHWYDNFALCFGYQKIRSANTPGGNRRNVFYFSKVRYD